MAARTETLFAEHRHQVFRYLCRVVGHSETARDLTQDVFLRVTRATVPTGDAAQVRAWVFRIARNLAADHFRHQQRRPEAGLPIVENGRPATQDTGLAVSEALASLDALDRDVFLMREVAGLGYEEIGEACDLTRAAVRSRIHRARMTLRAALRASVDERATRGVRLYGGRSEGHD